MKTPKPKVFQVGAIVRLSRNVKHVPPDAHRARGTIRVFYEDVPGGVKLDQPIGGYVSWNIEDLVLVHPAPPVSAPVTQPQRSIRHARHR